MCVCACVLGICVLCASMVSDFQTWTTGSLFSRPCVRACVRDMQAEKLKEAMARSAMTRSSVVQARGDRVVLSVCVRACERGLCATSSACATVC